MSTLKKVKRGEVYYIKSFPTTGSEQRSGRPAVIVSNDLNNSNSGTIEICYMTLQVKPNLPTHVFINRGSCINSTILCEQVTTVSVDKLGDYMCFLPDDIMDAVDKALVISLGLAHASSKPESTLSQRGNEAYLATPKVVMDELTALKNENAKLMDELRLAKDANETIKNNLVVTRSALDVTNTKAEMYERMYNDLIDRLVSRGAK